MFKGYDIQALANKIVRESIKLKPGEIFWISCGDPYYLDFAEASALAAVESGAYPFITLSSDRIALRKFGNSREYLERPSPLSPMLMNTVDAVLQLCFPRNPQLLRDVTPVKLGASSKAGISSMNALYARNVNRANIRMSSLFYPTPEAASYYGIPFEEYAALIRDALDIDYPSMAERCMKIADALRKGRRYRITSPDGSDLTFSLEDRRVFLDDGIMSDEDIEDNTFLQNLPAGEVCCAPVEESFEGTAVFRYNIFMGRPLVNFRVVFREGRVVDMSADSGLEHFLDIMEKNTGDKYRIAELGIGTNPGLTRIIGELALDEKIMGTIHLALGENRMLDGKNESSIHWDFVMQNPKLEVDDRVILEKGEYLV